MADFISLMTLPFLACLILTGIHAYLGVHVVARKVIFVDLALAQIAALGAVMAVLIGQGENSTLSYAFSLGAAFMGAIIFSFTRTRHDRIPQEAIIGIVYAVSAAAAILLLNNSAEGDEHLRHMLVGNILLVNGREVLKMLLLYGCIGLFHWKYREYFIAISTAPESEFCARISIRKWDLFFYLSFALVVTSSVRIAGVLLVFSYLVVPAVAAMLFAETIRGRLIFGWIFGTLVSLIAMTLSYVLDWPTGATVVCCFGAGLAGLAIFKLWRK